MGQVNLVEHFPIISSTSSIRAISTGQAFGNSDASSLVNRVNPFSNTDTYHWSSALDNKPSWAILDEDTDILHIRAHDCPNPATPLNPTCYNCIMDNVTNDTEFVFMWKTTRADSFSGRQAPSEPHSKPASVDHTIKPANTPIHELFDTPWTDVFGTAQYDLGISSELLLQHCGACSNPMDARLNQCAKCVESRAPDGFPGADYIMFVKMIRPEDGLERQNSFPGLHEARNGAASPPRFGSTADNSRNVSGKNNPNDTGNTKIFNS